MCIFRIVLLTVFMIAFVSPRPCLAQQSQEQLDRMIRLHDKATEGVKILPGMWRPHFPYEQIAWVKPPWDLHEYIWLDFPEAIFSDHGLIFLSHVNPTIVSVYPELPKVEWKVIEDGVSFERTLPNGVKFGGSVTKETDMKVALHLFLENGMDEPLKNITLQTCAYLNGIKQFNELTRDNKFVHLAEDGWLPFEVGREKKEVKGEYVLGWRRGDKIADWPIMITHSREKDRWIGMTWYTDTISMVSNQWHPCMHADPAFPDLAPRERADIHGSLLFFDGTLEEFTEVIKKDNPTVFK